MKKMALFLLTCTSLCAAENIELLIDSEEIAQKICETASVIDEEYCGEELTLVILMKGAICVTADLIRYLDTPCTIDYISTSSYGKNGMQRGQLSIEGLEKLDLEGKNVLVVDDIFDTGHTMKAVMDRLQEKKPKTLKSFVLLVKDVQRDIEYRPDYVLFDIPNRFVIGYGLDYKEYYRNLPGVYAFVNDTPPQ